MAESGAGSGIHHKIEMRWFTDSPTIGAIEQFFERAKKAGAPPNAHVEVSADEGQYGNGAHCSMDIRWTSPLEPEKPVKIQRDPSVKQSY